MQFPESWLREFCNPALSTQQLADTLTMGGLEVEELKPVAPPFSGIVVGEIREAVQHPNADKLRVCQVDVGQGSLLNIVCGAPNARVGIRVPCALVGAQLPAGDKPFEIKVGKLRGVESHGMLCSARELKLSDDHGGLLELAADAPLGQDIRAHLNLDDTLFTLKLTPNLAHCLSVHGVAREVSALTDTPMQVPQIQAARVDGDSRLPVKISAPDLCGRFSGRVIRGVNMRAATPAWMVERLARCGFTLERFDHEGVANLWATRGNSAPVFCFAGHTDVVPTGDLAAWGSDPFQPVIRDGVLFGRGAADMMSGSGVTST